MIIEKRRVGEEGDQHTWPIVVTYGIPWTAHSQFQSKIDR